MPKHDPLVKQSPQITWRPGDLALCWRRVSRWVDIFGQTRPGPMQGSINTVTEVKGEHLGFAAYPDVHLYPAETFKRLDPHEPDGSDIALLREQLEAKARTS